MNTYVISREDLAFNVGFLRTKAGKTDIWAVVKANGYGLGAGAFAKELEALGIRNFCVTELSEARELRQVLTEDCQILMLRQLCDPAEIRELAQEKVILTVGSSRAAQRICEATELPVRVHLKVDVGMGRYGFLPSEGEELLRICRDSGDLQICGIYTHFPCAFCDDKTTKAQFEEFMDLVKSLKEAGCDLGCVHCCNSSAFLRHPMMHLDAVRLGSALLGRMPFATELRPLGMVESCIEELRHLPKGHSTGYGSVWRAKRESTLAIIPVGRVHGLRVVGQPDRSRAIDCIRGMVQELRNLLKRPVTTVRIGGKACPVVGAVGSLHCAVDVTGLDCQVGQKVTLNVNPMYLKNMEVQFR